MYPFMKICLHNKLNLFNTEIMNTQIKNMFCSFILQQKKGINFLQFIVKITIHRIIITGQNYFIKYV